MLIKREKRKSFTKRKEGLIKMINCNYDSYLTSFLDYEDDDEFNPEDFTEEEIEARREEALIEQYERNKQTND